MWWLKFFQPRCMVRINLNDEQRCIEPATVRNSWGKFECEWHNNLLKDDKHSRKDEIYADSTLGKMHLLIAYFLHTGFGIKI